MVSMKSLTVFEIERVPKVACSEHSFAAVK